MIKVSEIIEEHKKGNVSKATLIKMAVFKAELEKRADPFFQSTLGKRVIDAGIDTAVVGAGGGIGALIYTGIQAMEHAWDKHQFKAELEPQFKKVLEDHPELEETEEKLNLARKYFEALHHFSPIMAASPLAAGAYIKQALEMHHVSQGPLPVMIEQATGIRKNIADASSKEKGEYSTPLGAAFLGFKPQAGKAYSEFKMPKSEETKEKKEILRSIKSPLYTSTSL